MQVKSANNGQENTRRTIRRLLGSAALIGLSALSSAVFAQTSPVEEIVDPNEIVVTAGKREQNIQDVAGAVTALGGEALAKSGAVDISDFVSQAPGLAFTRRGPSQNRLSIRGLTSFSGTDSEFPMVGLYIDEVPISDSVAPDAGLIDLERVEVLRGPQGTLYGEGSMGGTVRFVSAKPILSRFEGSVDGELSTTRFGGTNYKGSAILNAPIVTDKVGLRLVGFYQKDAGFVDNVALGKNNADAFDRYGARGTLLLKPDDNLSVTLSATYQTFKGGLEPVVFRAAIPGVTPPLLTQFGDTVAYRQVDEKLEDRLALGNLVLSYDFGGATLTSATSYYDRRIDNVVDEAATSRVVEAGLAPLAAAFGIDPFFLQNGTVVVVDGSKKTFAQEVRLVSDAKSALRWTIGGYYRNRKNVSLIDTKAPDIIPLIGVFNPDTEGELLNTFSSVKFEQYAVFGEATYALTDQFDVTGGLRWFRETITGAQTIKTPDFGFDEFGNPSPTFGVVQTLNLPTLKARESKLLWKLGASYKAGEDVLLYGSAAQGFRPGGVNARFDPGAATSPRAFKSDGVITYELGLKSSWLDRALTVNLAAYQTNLKDAQFLDGRDPRFPVIRNAGRARITGAEVEITARPADSFEFGASLSVLSAKFTENALGDGGTPEFFLINDGQRLPIARDYSVNAYAEHRLALSDSLNLVARGDVSHVSFASPNTNSLDRLKGYVEANARIGIESDRWSVAAFVDNAFDTVAELGSEGGFGFGISRNKPRTVGIRAGAKF
jgi:iron complex outermembrane recepter protein